MPKRKYLRCSKENIQGSGMVDVQDIQIFLQKQEQMAKTGPRVGP